MAPAAAGCDACVPHAAADEVSELASFIKGEVDRLGGDLSATIQAARELLKHLGVLAEHGAAPSGDV